MVSCQSPRCIRKDMAYIAACTTSFSDADASFFISHTNKIIKQISHLFSYILETLLLSINLMYLCDSLLFLPIRHRHSDETDCANSMRAHANVLFICLFLRVFQSTDVARRLIFSACSGEFQHIDRLIHRLSSGECRGRQCAFCFYALCPAVLSG